MYSSPWSHARAGVRTFIEAVAALAVHLVGGDVDEALDAPVHAAGFQQHMRAIRVVYSEGQAVAKAVVHMSLHRAQWLMDRTQIQLSVMAVASYL